MNVVKFNSIRATCLSVKTKGSETERLTRFELWGTQMLGQTVGPRTSAYVELGDDFRSGLFW